MKKNTKVTVVIPYHNEQKTINKTLKQIFAQTYKSFDVIFVNSQSSDNSSNLIDDFIRKKKIKKKFKNVNKKTFYPSSSKNIGVRLSQNNWIAFMDCDIFFDKNWLSNQTSFIREKKLSYSFGLCVFRGHGVLDSCFVAQTWGYDTEIPVIPSSIFNKSIFAKIGFFQNKRAGYDRIWKEKLKKFSKSKLIINKKSKIKYFKYNHASNFFSFIKKIYNYSLSSCEIKENFQPKVYIIFFLVFLLLYANHSLLFLYSISTYLIFRSYLYPCIKSKSLKIFKLSIFNIILMPVVGVSVDLTRVFAYFISYLKKLIKFFIPLKSFKNTSL